MPAYSVARDAISDKSYLLTLPTLNSVFKVFVNLFFLCTETLHFLLLT